MNLFNLSFTVGYSDDFLCIDAVVTIYKSLTSHLIVTLGLVPRNGTTVSKTWTLLRLQKDNIVTDDIVNFIAFLPMLILY